MKIKRFKIKDLIPAPYNPRTISDSALSGLRASIKRFGYVDPIIRNSNGHIIGGHQRIKALLAEGYDPDTEIEVVLVDIPEIEEKALNIALNNPAIQGDFDYLKLEPLLLELREGLGDLVLEELKLDELMDMNPETKRHTAHGINVQSDFAIDDYIKGELDKADAVCFSFSGGRDSALAFYSVINHVDKSKVELVYVDTGVELPDLIVYIVNFAKFFDMPLTVVKPEHNFIEHYLNRETVPNPQMKGCIELFIATPVNKYLANFENPILVRGGRSKQGIPIESSHGVTITDRAGSVDKVFYKRENQKYPIYNPLYLLSDEGYEKLSQEFLKTYKFWDGYERGFHRTACWCCPFQTIGQYRALKTNYPILWERLKDIEMDITVGNTDLNKGIDRIEGRVRTC